jgi:SAM-dependent methyltransferase
MQDYYDRRVPEYERIYERDDAVRQAEQTALANCLRETLRDRTVLELACGTGYWTRGYSPAARSVLATDASDPMLAYARQQMPTTHPVTFARADAYDLTPLPGTFDAGVALFWLSHVPKARLAVFLNGFLRRLEPGAVVVLADNVYIPGLGGDLITHPDRPDTCKRRTLADGSTHEILKNYFTESDLRNLLQSAARNLRIHYGQCFWWACFEVGDRPPVGHHDVAPVCNR